MRKSPPPPTLIYACLLEIPHQHEVREQCIKALTTLKTELLWSQYENLSTPGVNGFDRSNYDLCHAVIF